MGIKHYDKAFKKRAVKLSEERSSVLQAARELGVSINFATTELATLPT